MQTQSEADVAVTPEAERAGWYPAGMQEERLCSPSDAITWPVKLLGLGCLRVYLMGRPENDSGTDRFLSITLSELIGLLSPPHERVLLLVNDYAGSISSSSSRRRRRRRGGDEAAWHQWARWWEKTTGLVMTRITGQTGKNWTSVPL